MKNILKRFDEEFIKDMGPNVEPIFIDAIGSVGPIKDFIKSEVEGILIDVLAIKDKDFKRGERKWCIECADRINKDIKEVAKKHGFDIK